jgi:hypothetical protein
MHLCGENAIPNRAGISPMQDASTPAEPRKRRQYSERLTNCWMFPKSLMTPSAAHHWRECRVGTASKPVAVSEGSFCARIHRFTQPLCGGRTASAIKRGVRQYVIFGAGLDTFGYRNPYAEPRLRVFEVDHPATQSWKRMRLRGENNDIRFPDFRSC